MITRKTYAVNGFVEWACYINIGSSRVQVLFEGGGMSSYGNTPAKFTTNSQLFQAIIEGSDYFKNGTIYLLRQSEIDGVDTSVQTNKTIESSASEVKSVETQDADPVSYTEVEVTDKNDAVEYLKEHYDETLTATKLKSKAAFDAVCEQYKVKFIFAE